MEGAEEEQTAERTLARMLNAAPGGRLKVRVFPERWPRGLEECSRELSGSWKRKEKDVGLPAGLQV